MRWYHSLSLITMNSQFPSSAILLVFLFCILIGLINMPPCDASALYENCSTSFNCGNITVTYPFWGDNRDRACGYDQLKLTCEKGLAKINISSVKYRLLDYNPSDQVMRIARDDYATSGLCSPTYPSTTLDPALFELFAGYANITLLYGCPANGFPNTWGHFTCPVSGTSNTDGYVTAEAIYSIPTTCSASVVALVQVLNLNLSDVSSSVEIKLQQGFEVLLKVDTSCNECIQSKGVCGYDPSENQATCYCMDGTSGSKTCSPTTADAPQGQPTNKDDAPQGQPTNGSKNAVSLGIALAIAGAAISGVAITVIIIFTCPKKWFRRSLKPLGYVDNITNVEVAINTNGFLAPKRYKYFELRNITNSFTENIGQGGYGTVYKGKLPDSRLVAVKLLIESKSQGEEFINEVVSISRTSHINVVNLLGFCYERNKRALIYEFMPNGSLDKFIPPEGALHTSSKINWKILHQIVLGIARGLEYLHRGCKTRILHFDIKPQNILLDEDFVPKISDFGLAKLCLGKESMVSLLGTRGTVGYIALEVFSRTFGRVSHKSDVYSYGMLVLTMVCGKNINNEQVSNSSSDMYFPHGIYKQLEPNRDFKFQGITTDEEEQIARKLMLVSLWCIQTNPSNRPSMTKVIEMLEGSLHSLDMPPEPFLSYPMSQHQSMDIATPLSSNNKDDEEEESSLVVNRI